METGWKPSEADRKWVSWSWKLIQYTFRLYFLSLINFYSKRCCVILIFICVCHRSAREMELDNDFDKLTSILKRLLLQVKVHTIQYMCRGTCERYVQLQNTCRAFLQENQNSWPFLEPVSEDQAPEYYKLIKFPMGRYYIHNWFNLLPGCLPLLQTGSPRGLS